MVGKARGKTSWGCLGCYTLTKMQEWAPREKGDAFTWRGRSGGETLLESFNPFLTRICEKDNGVIKEKCGKIGDCWRQINKLGTRHVYVNRVHQSIKLVSPTPKETLLNNTL